MPQGGVGRAALPLYMRRLWPSSGPLGPYRENPEQVSLSQVYLPFDLPLLSGWRVAMATQGMDDKGPCFTSWLQSEL